MNEKTQETNEQEWVDLNMQFPDGTEELVPIEKEVFLQICEMALKENKTVENKFLEILESMIDQELEKEK